jgi:hypothetical protein
MMTGPADAPELAPTNAAAAAVKSIFRMISPQSADHFHGRRRVVQQASFPNASRA